MRLCRYQEANVERSAFYEDDAIIPVGDALTAHNEIEGKIDLPHDAPTIDYLPGGRLHERAVALYAWLTRNAAVRARLEQPLAEVALRAPHPRPPKLFLLAGNYAEHIEEGGDVAVERAETFPYVFMKPPSTTINHPGAPIPLPANSPNAIDWEIELAVIIGKKARRVSEAEALSYVAGYTVVNDISDRRFRPNPERRERPKDNFFDWLHGKWHDGFCPMGPCIRAADTVEDPQSLSLHLSLNGEIQQDSSTARQVFPVAAVISFVSNIATLEVGDIISTGTPAGIGAPKEKFLRAGDVLEARIEGIGVLRNTVIDEGSC